SSSDRAAVCGDGVRACLHGFRIGSTCESRAMSRKNRKRREQRRRPLQPQLEERRHGRPPAKSIEQVIEQTKYQLSIPQLARWPGGCDASLVRPDAVKLDFATWATSKSPGREKCQQLEDGLLQGFLSELPEIDHWGWEEFLWHGLPGDSWHPLDAYLAQSGARFPPAAQEQLRLWKQARIGLFEIGDLANDTLGLHEWDAVAQKPIGLPFRALTLNIGGI